MLFAALLLGIIGSAQENSLLWKISGNGLTKDSYLFGTLHMACAEDFHISEKIKTAIGATDALAVEVDATNPETMALIQRKIEPKPNFFDHLSAEKRHAIDSALIAKEIPPTIFDQISPAAVISLIALKDFACNNMNDVKMMEHELKNLPQAQGKPVEELESATFQMDLLDTLFSAEDLYHYLTSPFDMQTITKALVTAYFSENLQEIENMTENTAYLSPAKLETLLKTRNETWIQKMPAMMRNKSFVFAVGAAHLTGKNGVIQLLRDKGYTLTAVTN